jgi:peroxiredoxin
MGYRIWWALILLIASWSLLPAAPQAAKCNAIVGGPAPALQGSDMAGRTVNLGNMRGKWVYIDFWASWCKPCMRDLPQVVELHDSLSHLTDFSVLSIALDDQSTLDKLQEVTDEYRIAYPVVCDSAGWSSPHVQEWCVSSIPATYLIDPEGRIVERNISPGDVPGLIAQARLGAPRTSKPSTAQFDFNAKHRLLKDSPTSGKRGNRDLQISLPRPLTSTARYQLVIRAEQPVAAKDRTLMVKYDLEFNPGKPGSEFPFEVAIREATGARVGIQDSKAVTVNTTATAVLPGAQIAFDVGEQRLLFILPLPAKLVSASYTVSLYDPVLQHFGTTLAADISTV